MGKDVDQVLTIALINVHVQIHETGMNIDGVSREERKIYLSI
jgi:hypothetical protein